MNDLPSHRWNPDSIARRWRHVFWIVPLLGLLAGLAIHFTPMFRSTTTGIVAGRPIVPSGSGAPSINPTALAEVICSDDVLWKTTIDLDLPGRWGIEGEECVAELRNRVTCKAVRHTRMVAVFVKLSDQPDAIEVWKSIVSQANDHFAGARKRELELRVQTAQANVGIWSREAEKREQAVSDLRLKSGSEVYDNPLDMRGPDPVHVKAHEERSKAFDELHRAKIAQAVAEVAQRLESDALVIHEEPRAAAPANLREALHSLFFHSSIGIGAGMILALVLAYLQELVFPRKQADEISNPG